MTVFVTVFVTVSVTVFVTVFVYVFVYGASGDLCGKSGVRFSVSFCVPGQGALSWNLYTRSHVLLCACGHFCARGEAGEKDHCNLQSRAYLQKTRSDLQL